MSTLHRPDSPAIRQPRGGLRWYPEYFWSKVAVGTPAECWPWLGSQTERGGYGRVTFIVEGRRESKAHRVAWFLANGAIPDGLTIDHLCRNGNCQNPAHMELVSKAENTFRRYPYLAADVCSRGHDLTDPRNAYVHPPTGHRACRQCKRDREQKAAV